MNLRNNIIDENLLQRLESQKISISQAIGSKTIDNKFLRKFIFTSINHCRILSFSLKVKESEYNFYLFRLKELLIDFYSLFLTYSTYTDITYSDVFFYINFIVEYANEQKSILNIFFIENHQEKIELIINYLFSKESEIDVMLNMDQKYYDTVFNYFSFILENFCDIESINNLYKEHYEKNDNIYLKIISVEEIENKAFNLIYRILLLFKNIKFKAENQSTNRFFFVLTKKIFSLLEYLNKSIFNYNINLIKGEKKNINSLNTIKPLNWILESEIDFNKLSYEELMEILLNNQDVFKEDNGIKIIFVFYFFVNMKNKQNIEKIYICEIYRLFFDFFINLKDFYDEKVNEDSYENISYMKSDMDMIYRNKRNNNCKNYENEDFTNMENNQTISLIEDFNKQENNNTTRHNSARPPKEAFFYFPKDKDIIDNDPNDPKLSIRKIFEGGTEYTLFEKEEVEDEKKK